MAAKAATLAAMQQSTNKKGGKDATEVAAVTMGWQMGDVTVASVGRQGRGATVKQPFLCNEHNFM